MADESPIVLRQPRIEPPEGWSPFTPEGVLRIDQSDDGRLARLDAVVAFIMARDGLPCSAVVEAVCDAVDTQGDALPLYLLQKTVYAVALPGIECFGGLGLHGRDIRPGTCGRAGAVGAMRRYWGAHTRPECSVYEAVGLDCVAVTLRQACELWGYGQAVTPDMTLPLPASFAPAPGWRIDDARGYMAFDRTATGRLVLLRDVVLWLSQSKSCPLRLAVADVVEELAETWAMSWLYLVAPGDYARPLRTDDCFDNSQAIAIRYFGYPEPPTDSIGLLGLLYAMQEHWGADGLPDADQVQRNGLQALERAAIRMDVAHALWGWGTAAGIAVAASAPFPLADWPALVAYRKANPGKDWGLGNQLDILRTELERRMRGGHGESAALTEMAGELEKGSRQSLKKALSGERTRAKKKPEAYVSTIVKGGEKFDTKAA